MVRVGGGWQENDDDDDDDEKEAMMKVMVLTMAVLVAVEHMRSTTATLCLVQGHNAARQKTPFSLNTPKRGEGGHVQKPGCVGYPALLPLSFHTWSEKGGRGDKTGEERGWGRAGVCVAVLVQR